MPFQVVFNTVQIGLPPVTLLSAGENRNVACGNTIFLEGTVDIVENLSGHDILWEQIAGVPVVLSSTNTLATSYSFVERSDKIFRLWLDKDTDFAQFKEISIFHTPTSVMDMSLSNSTVAIGVIADFVECATISGFLTFFADIPSPTGPQDVTPCQPNGGIPTTGILFDFSVTWTVPDAKTDLIPHFLDSQLFYADSDIPASPRYTDAPGSVVTHHFLPGGENELKRYYILTRYSVAENIFIGQSCVVDYTGTKIPAGHVVDDRMKMVLSNSSIERINYSNFFLVNISPASMALGNSSIGRINYTNNFLNNLASATEFGLSNSAINITRFDPTGIGT